MALGAMRLAAGSTPFPPRIERHALHERFDSAARRRVCIVIGAAGWGKSTAVESWSQDRRTAWVRYERQSADPTRFAHAVCDALRLHAPAAVSAVRPVLAVHDDGVEAAAVAICAWLRRWLRDDLVLVVDDLQELPPDSDPVRLLEGLCRHAPDRLHLVLISRRECPFSLARLRGHGLVTELHAPELAFDLDEVAALLRLHGAQGPPGLAERVRDRTGGWPTVTCRVVEALRAVKSDHRISVLDRASGPGDWLHGYLDEEVLRPEPERARELLRRLAVVGAVSARTVVALGTDDDPRLLAELARRGHVYHIPGHVDRWSLAAPLRDHFDQQPTTPNAAERANLHRVAAGECVDRGTYAEALRHLLAADEHGACASLLAEHGVALVNSGRVSAVLGAAALPVEHLTDPEIQRVLGQARQVRGQWEEAMACFQRVGDCQEQMHPGLAWRVGMIAYSQGEFTEVRALRARSRCDGEGTVDEARLFALIAHAHRMTGDYDGCRVETERAADAAQRSDSPCAKAAAFSALAVLAEIDGDRLRSDAYWVRAVEAAEAAGDLLQAVSVRLLRAFHLVEEGFLREGLAEAATGLRLSESYGDPFLTAHALTIRARANIRVGALDRVVDDLTRARDLFQRLRSRFLAWPLCGLGDAHRLRGQLARARAAYEQALSLSEPCHDVPGMSSALIGLARVRAADDIVTARELAHRAVDLGERLHSVQAVLTSGWVALMAGDRQAAADAGTRAAAAARSGRDDPGLAEALTLVVVSAVDPSQHGATLVEAITIWDEVGCRVDAAAARILANRTDALFRDPDPDRAERTLREIGLDVEPRQAAGPLAVLARWRSAVSIRSLGFFQVFRAGVAVPRNAWQSRKARDLLKILVARRRSVTRDQLMEFLWPDVDTSRAGNRLSVVLTTLRDVLEGPDRPAGEGVLVTDGNAVWLDRSKVTVDVEEFLAHATTALEAHHNGEPGAVDRLIAAEAEHTGDFLEEDPQQEWAMAVAEDVRASHIALLRALATALGDRGDVNRVVRYTLRLLQQDRYDEQAHLELVQAHLDAGHHGEAHRCYQIYAQRMVELGVEHRPFPGHRRSTGSAG